jgi:hypothetical protein
VVTYSRVCSVSLLWLRIVAYVVKIQQYKNRLHNIISDKVFFSCYTDQCLKIRPCVGKILRVPKKIAFVPKISPFPLTRSVDSVILCDGSIFYSFLFLLVDGILHVLQQLMVKGHDI